MTASVLGGQHHPLLCPLSHNRSSQCIAATFQPQKLSVQRQQLARVSPDITRSQRGPSNFEQTAVQQQKSLCSRRRVVSPAAISADAGIPVVASQQAGAEPVQSRGLGSLTSRILSGSVLGLSGGLIILAGGWVFTAATCLVAYQATQEFYGFITSKVSPWTPLRGLDPYHIILAPLAAVISKVLLRLLPMADRAGIASWLAPGCLMSAQRPCSCAQYCPHDGYDAVIKNRALRGLQGSVCCGMHGSTHSNSADAMCNALLLLESCKA